MTQAQQPEALRLAELLDDDDCCYDWLFDKGVEEVSAELRRLHAANEALRACYDADKATIAALQSGYDAARLEIASLQSQLDAIGAGGVEPLRKRECLHQISDPVGAYPPLPEPWP